ncbi:MAG: hypothetical protein WCH35_17085 [Comamonadaceae bacterium]
MDVQSLAVFVVVSCCFVYAAWSLMPQVARRALANGLLRLPLPQQLAFTLRKAVSASTGCQCSGCDHATAKVDRASGGAEVSQVASQVLVFHPRRHQ